jgi:hypothetical protein
MTLRESSKVLVGLVLHVGSELVANLLDGGELHIGLTDLAAVSRAALNVLADAEIEWFLGYRMDEPGVLDVVRVSVGVITSVARFGYAVSHDLLLD